MDLLRNLVDALAPLAKGRAGAAELLARATAAAATLEGAAGSDAACLDATRALEEALRPALEWVKRRAQKRALQSSFWQALKASETEAKYLRFGALIRERDVTLGRALASAFKADASVDPARVPAWAARFPDARRLKVRGSGASAAAVWAAAFSAIAASLPLLEELDLGSDHDAGFGAASTLALATSVLPRLVGLRALVLTGNELGDADAAAALAAALPRLAKLEKLEARRTRLGAAGAALLFAALAGLPSSSLRELDVGGNEFGSAGAESLAAALPSLRRLEKLELGATQIGAAGASALFMALPSAPLLEELDVRHAGFGGAGAATLSSAVPRLPHLKVLRVKGNKLEASAGKDHLVAAVAAAGPRLELEI